MRDPASGSESDAEPGGRERVIACYRESFGSWRKSSGADTEGRGFRSIWCHAGADARGMRALTIGDQHIDSLDH